MIEASVIAVIHRKYQAYSKNDGILAVLKNQLYRPAVSISIGLGRERNKLAFSDKKHQREQGRFSAIAMSVHVKGIGDS